VKKRSRNRVIFLSLSAGKTGKDGIHGATFSSDKMSSATRKVDAGAVQMGAPIEEKGVFDALTACRNADVISAQTDVGGGGYSAAICELGEETGVRVYLDRVPLKYTGLSPKEIWLSESQERMVIAVHPDKLEECLRICASCEASAHVLGEFTGDHKVTLLYNDKVVGELPMDFLHHGLPQRRLNMEHIPYPENNAVPQMPGNQEEWVSAYKQVLGNLNVASTEVMLRQFDTTVQGRTVLHPFTGVHQDAPNDASVLAPIYGKPYGLVTSHALNPILNRYDPYKGTMWAVAMAASKLTAVGGNINEAAMIDNFVWPFPNKKFLGDLDLSVNALCRMMDCLQIPCVSGKDSLSSTFDPKDGNPVINIPPVLNMTIFGKIPDIKKTVTLDIKKPGSTLVLVGKADVENLGGSIYLQTQGIENTHIPEVNTDQLIPVLDNIRSAIQGRTPKNEGPVTRLANNVLDNIRTAIQGNTVLSCKAVGEGGLATMLAQMCFGGDCGANIDLQALEATRPDFGLFNETAGTFIVEVSNEGTAQKLFRNVPHVILGKTTKKKSIQVKNGATPLFEADLYELKQAWQEPLGKALS
jgi:phosphoribosylformylglycinamidine synthase subunit PurSL